MLCYAAIYAKIIGQIPIMEKIFVLDTNVLLHNAQALKAFGDNRVVIPLDVIEELDRFKKEPSSRGRNARSVIRMLDGLRKKGPLNQGVKMENGGMFQILLQHPQAAKDTNLDPHITDNRILMVAHGLKKQGKHVIFVSKDINARIKSDVLGVHAVDYEKQKIDFDKLYNGWRKMPTNPKKFANYIKNEEMSSQGMNLCPHEFVLLENTGDGQTALFKHDHKKARLVMMHEDKTRWWNIAARSMEQRMAMELLANPDVRLVTLMGQAGTGKTLLALAAGLQQVVIEKKYQKMLVSRPIMPLGKDIGYLPGSKEEKIEHWMDPIYDNLEFILSYKSTDAEVKIYQLLNDGKIVMEALTYMRGRSIPNQFIIVDEAQNLTPHEIKTIISRAGHGTKMILTGDPYQIDNPYLDASSNGLSYAVERLKENPLHGHVTLTKSERSDLASIAAELL